MQPIHVERKRFDRYLTRIAEQAGAEIWLKTTAVSIAREEQWMVAPLRRLGPAETIMRAALPRWLLYPSVVMAASAVGWSLSADRLLGLPHDAAVQALVFALAFLFYNRGRLANHARPDDLLIGATKMAVSAG